MDVSVVICTYNRADSLRRTLESLCKLVVHKGTEWELILVDNCSTDGTPEVAREFQTRLPLRYVYEPKQGISRARNRGLAEAAGEFILFTDDDVLVDTCWLCDMLDAAKQYTERAFFCGPVIPYYIDGKPRWLTPDLERTLGSFVMLFDPYDVDCEIQPGPIVPPTANFGVRRSIVEAFGMSFDPRLGYRGRNTISGEDSRFVREMWEKGLVGRYVASARVRHVNDSKRINLMFLWKWAQGTGFTHTIIRKDVRSERRVFGVPLWTVRSFITNILGLCVPRIRRPDKWVRKWGEAARAWGCILAGLKGEKI